MFCICHDQGFLVCKASPFAILNNRILGGDISIAQMLDMSNIIFLASGGGEKPRYSLTHVIMFDDHKGKPVAQLQVGHRIKNLKANAKRLFVVGKSKIFLFKTEDLSNVGTFESYEDNEEGICSLAESKENIVFAYPAKVEGQISIMRIKDKITDVRSFYVHNKKIACIELNKDGDRLLSSSIYFISEENVLTSLKIPFSSISFIFLEYSSLSINSMNSFSAFSKSLYKSAISAKEYFTLYSKWLISAAFS